MLQLIQNIKTGELKLEEVPPPSAESGMVQVKTYASLISAGTEKMLIELAQKSLVGKAQARPDLVKQVLSKAKKEGWINTVRNVQSKMEKPLPLGYSAAGLVLDSGSEAGLTAGEKVAIAGAGYANHAEINSVPLNLCAIIPEAVSFEEAAYTTVASIALQGVRLAKPELGEYVVVSGLGLIGLITVQLLKANGCFVIGIDYDQKKIDLGLKLGMDEGLNLSDESIVSRIESFTKGRLADHTIITASTSSNQPIELAGEITRRKGQVIVVGAVGMNVPRDIYYKKEIELKISMSYGPGRYDISYEEGGIDYPYDYVRWTEQRNMQAVLDLMAQKKLDVKSLTTHRFKFSDALTAYDMIKSSKEHYVGMILEYDVEKPQEKILQLKMKNEKLKIGITQKDKLSIGFIGAGNYASLHLLPHLKTNNKILLKGLATASGSNAKQKAEKFGFEFCSTDFDDLIKNDEIDTIFIATRHSTHADFTIKALNAGKKVFVEKPLCVNEEQLSEIIDTFEPSPASPFNKVGDKEGVLMVGLNRRFAPMTIELKNEFSTKNPKQILYRVNSGHIPTNTWLHLLEEGGGMLVGEMCHFIDMMSFLTNEFPVSVTARSLKNYSNSISDFDNVSILVEFDGGSTGTLLYNTIGSKKFSKERLEIYSSGKVGIIDDFRSIEIMSDGKKKKHKTANQDKGQANQITRTIEGFVKNQSPIPFNELVNTMQVIFGAKKSILSGQSIKIEPYK